MDRRTDADIKKFIKALERVVTQHDMKEILERSVRPTIDAVQNRIPIEKYKRTRYLNGKKVATYYPGNLRRSFKLLDKLNKRHLKGNFALRKVWFGINLHRGDSRGVFKGSRTDGYYAHMVNNGTEKYTGRFFFERGMNAGKNPSLLALKREYIRQFSNRARREGLK